VKVSSRARRHEDRGGDPLDGLVNLFDLGIVLSVAFLLAALASLDLTSVLTEDRAVPAGETVTAEPDETVQELELNPGERVVGSGEEIGRVYQLEDGRTVIVRPDDATPAPGEIGPAEPDAPGEAAEPVTPLPEAESEAPTDPAAPVVPESSTPPAPVEPIDPDLITPP